MRATFVAGSRKFKSVRFCRRLSGDTKVLNVQASCNRHISMTGDAIRMLTAMD